MKTLQSNFPTLNINLDFEDFKQNKILLQQLEIYDLKKSTSFDSEYGNGILDFKKLSEGISVLVFQIRTNQTCILNFEKNAVENPTFVCVETFSDRKSTDFKGISTIKNILIPTFSAAKIIVFDFPKAILNFTQNQPFLPFAFHGYQYFDAIFHSNHPIEIGSNLYGLASFLVDEFSGEKKSEISEIDRKNLMLLEKQIVEKQDFSSTVFSIENWAMLALMCPTKFKQKFKILFGETPYQYFQNFRMEIAKRLVLEKKLTISEIAFRIGYNSIGRFSTAFFAKFGILPSKC